MKWVLITYNPTDDEFLFWSNKDGWVDLESATQFTLNEKDGYLGRTNNIKTACWVTYDRAKMTFGGE